MMTQEIHTSRVGGDTSRVINVVDLERGDGLQDVEERDDLSSIDLSGDLAVDSRLAPEPAGQTQF